MATDTFESDLPSLSRLAPEQEKSFDVEYIGEDVWRRLLPFLDSQLDCGGDVLDVGGGNGSFLDRLLRRFPEVRAINLEPSEPLRASNRTHPRKQIVDRTLQEWSPSDRYDVVHFHWVLHHIVSNSYRMTRQAQVDALIKAREMLRPNGRILVLENVWDGRRVDDLPGRLLYELTSSRALRPLIQRLGSNSAGVGVAYHSQSAWLDLFTRAGLSLVHRPVRYDYGTSSELRQFLLHTRPPRVEAFILRPSV